MYGTGKEPMMNETVQSLYDRAIELPPQQRMSLVEMLTQSFDVCWRKEVDSRCRAYKQGHLKSISLDELTQRLGRA
jgi:putative addiction module component (TIGR02574 family)